MQYVFNLITRLNNVILGLWMEHAVLVSNTAPRRHYPIGGPDVSRGLEKSDTDKTIVRSRVVVLVLLTVLFVWV